MSSSTILLVLVAYFGLLYLISWWTSRNSTSSDFFTANRSSPWYVVAFGMVGASLSGVTFISIPGAVGGEGLNQDFSYMQAVFGYMVGYVVIAQILLPLYYRMNLTSIYTYLKERFGRSSYKTGSAFFLLSRIVGASFRLYLVALVLDAFVLSQMGVPFWVTVLATVTLIWLYTFRGGIKTVVWTDTLQTASMLIAVGLAVTAMASEMNLSFGGVVDAISQSEYSQMFFFEGGWGDPNNFFKQFLSGAFITIVMTGLDQDMMQKNLTCRNLRDAQKNMYSFTAVLVVVNLLFLSLGVLMYLYAQKNGISIPTKLVNGEMVAARDQLFPMLALKHLSPMIGVVFVIGLVAAAYSSADSALTALTTSFSVDILEMDPHDDSRSTQRKWIHVGMALVLFVVILGFRQMNDDSVINQLFKAAGYTYGPLLGLYAFGLFTKRSVLDKWVPIIAILSPIICYLLNANSEAWLGGYKFGFELLILNGLLTFIGLALISHSPDGK